MTNQNFPAYVIIVADNEAKRVAQIKEAKRKGEHRYLRLKEYQRVYRDKMRTKN